MAGIKTSIELTDGVSSVLSKINKRLSLLQGSVTQNTRKFHELEGAVKGAINEQLKLTTSVKPIPKSLEDALLQQDKLTRSANKTVASEERLATATNNKFKSEKQALRASEQLKQAITGTAIKQEQLTQATHRTWQAQEKTKQSIEKTSQVQTQTKIKQEQLTQATQKTNQEVAKTSFNEQKVKTEVERTNNEHLKGRNIVSRGLNILAQHLGILQRTKTEVERTDNEKRKGLLIEQKTNNEKLRGIRLQQQIEAHTAKAAQLQQKYSSYVRSGLNESNRFLQSMRNMLGVYVGYQSIGGVINTADTLTTTKARLDMINDGLQTTDALQKKIYESAMNSRSGYAETADVVAKLATRAGKVFGSNDEAISFANTLQKMFHIAGASTQEMNSASLQLVQALGSGVLRGEELNAVFEAAPNVIQAIADYMNLPVGKIRKLAKEGEISADVVKNAMFDVAEEVNKKFASMPVTWAQAWTIFKNFALQVFTPLLQAISAITSSDRFIGFVDGLAKAMGVIAKIITKVFDKVSSIGAYIYDNWKTLKPAIMGVVGAIVALTITMNAAKTIAAVYNLYMGIATARHLRLAKVTFAQIVQQTSLNSAILACPWFWLVGGLMLLIGVIGSCVLATYDWEKSNIDLVATIKNVFSKIGQFLRDTVLAAWEKLKEIGVKVRDILAEVGQTIMDNWSGISTVIWGVVVAFASYAVIMGIVTIATAIYTGVLAAYNAVKSVALFLKAFYAGLTLKEAAALSWLAACEWAANLPLIAKIVLIGLIIAAIAWLIAKILEWCGVTVSATGIICAVFAYLGSVIYNVFAFAWNIIAAFVEFFVNVWSNPIYSIKLLFINLGLAIVGMWGAVASTIDKVAKCLVEAIDWAINKCIDGINWLINKLPAKAREFLGISGEIGQVSLSDDLGSFASQVDEWKSALESMKGEKPADYWEAPKLGNIDNLEAIKAGYEFGESFENGIKNFSMNDIGESLKTTFKDGLDGLIVKKNPAQTNPASGLSDPAKALSGGYDNPAGKDYAKDIAKNTGDTADNTSSLAKSDEHLGYMRQLAESDAINRFTTSNTKVEVTNNNKIDSKLDMDEFVDYISNLIANPRAAKSHI